MLCNNNFKNRKILLLQTSANCSKIVLIVETESNFIYKLLNNLWTFRRSDQYFEILFFSFSDYNKKYWELLNKAAIQVASDISSRVYYQSFEVLYVNIGAIILPAKLFLVKKSKQKQKNITVKSIHSKSKTIL